MEINASGEMIGIAHLTFLRAIGGDPKNLNLSYLAKRVGIKNNRLWFYANGKCRWKADSWIKVMVALGKIDLSGLLSNEELLGLALPLPPAGPKQHRSAA